MAKTRTRPDRWLAPSKGGYSATSNGRSTSPVGAPPKNPASASPARGTSPQAGNGERHA